MMPLVLVKRIKGKFFSTGIGQFFMLLNVLQIIFVFVIKIILSLRFKERLIYISLTPVSVCFIIAVAVNSYIQARFRKGVYRKRRIYEVNKPEHICLISDNFYDDELSEKLDIKRFKT